MDAGLRPRRLLPAISIATLATGIFAAWVGWSVGGEQTTLYFDDLATVLAALAASLLCTAACVRQGRELRRFWWLLAAACGAWTLGEAIWAVHELVLREPVAVPSWADLGYLGAIPLAVAALLSHPAMAGRGIRQARLTLDALLVATALLFLSWTLVLGPLWQSADLSTVGGMVAIAYPFGDVVIVFFVMLVVRRMASAHRLALWCLLAGLLALAISDSVYAYLTEIQGYESATLLDTGWFAGYTAIGLAAFCSRAPLAAPRHIDRAAPSLAGLVVPFVPILSALAVVALKPTFVQQLDPVAFTSASALVALVLGRQLLVMIDAGECNGQHGGTFGERLQAAFSGTVPSDIQRSDHQHHSDRRHV